MKVKLKPQTSLSEIVQLVDIKFAQANIKDDVAVAVIPLCKCRDFLLDVVYANHHPDVLTSYNIYGMSYNVKTDPLDLSKTVFIVKFKDQKQLDNFHNNLGLLQRVEEHNKFQTSKVYAADDDPLMVVIEGDAQWSKTTLATNVYTLLMKLCAYEVDKSMDIYKYFHKDHWLKGQTYGAVPTEVQYLSQIGKDFFEFIIQNMRTVIEDINGGYVNGFDASQSIHQVHSYSGIATAHRNALHNQPKPKYYQRMSEAFAKFKLEKELFSLGVQS